MCESFSRNTAAGTMLSNTLIKVKTFFYCNTLLIFAALPQEYDGVSVHL